MDPDPKQTLVPGSASKRGMLNCARQWGKSTITAMAVCPGGRMDATGGQVGVSPEVRVPLVYSNLRANPSVEELIARQENGPTNDVSVPHDDVRPIEERIEDSVAAPQEWRGHNRPGRGGDCSAPPLPA